MSRLPIRARMTAGFALAMVVVLAGAAVFVYMRQRADLTETIDNGLNSRSDDVAALLRESDTDLEQTGGGRRLGDPEDSFVQVLTPAGRRLDGTPRVRTPALPPAEARRASRETTLSERSVPGIEGSARVLARPVAARDRTLVVVAGASLADREETLAGLRRSFLIGGPIAVLLASGIGYLLAAGGLAPVEAMRRRATRVSLEHGGERLPLPAAHDEVRRLGETLNEMLARLEESFQRERLFVADASHELRTPLAVLKTELEAAIRSGDYSAEVRESLTAALEETDHLVQLADDLLLIARSAEGRLPVRRETVDVAELLERTRQRFADRAGGHDREIRVHAPGGLTTAVDPLRTRQALGNLVDNALRHGEGDVALSARQGPDGVEVDVSDQGPGFPPELESRAFERFARAGGERSRGGSGLGLAIVLAIAEAHEGTAAIVENGSRGATVRLCFPSAAAAE